MKKKNLLLSGLFSLFVLILVVTACAPKSYEIEYKIDGQIIEEKYDKERGFYVFSTRIDEKEYAIAIRSGYLHKKKLIESLDFLNEEEERCLLMKSEKLEEYPVCYKNDELVDYGLITNQNEDFYKREQLKRVDVQYEGINLKNLERKYFIWNYRGYYFVDGEVRSEIKFLKDESYQNNLAYSDGEYIITPNYDQNYSFTEVYIINMKNGKLSRWDLKNEISFNSYYMGDIDGNIYIIDRKSKSEYKLNIGKKKIERIDKDGTGIIYEDGWKEVSMSKLVSEDYAFGSGGIIEYTLEDNKLKVKCDGRKDVMLVTDKKVDKIISISDNTVFYLVGDEVYSYSFKYGENTMFKYGELNFNNKNSVFIY